jgi:hypothetical protein
MTVFLVQSRRNILKQKSCLMFKVYHKLGPSYLSQPFNRANLIHCHGTRLMFKWVLWVNELWVMSQWVMSQWVMSLKNQVLLYLTFCNFFIFMSTRRLYIFCLFLCPFGLFDCTQNIYRNNGQSFTKFWVKNTHTPGAGTNQSIK